MRYPLRTHKHALRDLVVAFHDAMENAVELIFKKYRFSLAAENKDLAVKKDQYEIIIPHDIRAAFEDEASDNGEPSVRIKQIRKLIDVVDGLNNLAGSIPKRYEWDFMTAEAFARRVENLKNTEASCLKFNRLYWGDTDQTVRAYMVMCIWRMVDICSSAFAVIEQEGILSAAILARSALETSMQYVQDARSITATIEKTCKNDFIKKIVTNGELEAYLLKTVFASRQENTEEIYKSRNILTTLEKIAKLVPDTPIKQEYELLCEVTHPNFIGRSIYILEAMNSDGTGNETRIITHENGGNAIPLMQSALWALSWSIDAQLRSTEMLQAALNQMQAKLYAH